MRVVNKPERIAPRIEHSGYNYVATYIGGFFEWRSAVGQQYIIRSLHIGNAPVRNGIHCFRFFLAILWLQAQLIAGHIKAYIIGLIKIWFYAQRLGVPCFGFGKVAYFISCGPQALKVYAHETILSK